MHLADLMEKSEGGQFLILSHLLQHSPSSLSEVMAETDFSKATLNKYLALINDKAKENQLALSIEVEDEKTEFLSDDDEKTIFLDAEDEKTEFLSENDEEKTTFLD